MAEVASRDESLAILTSQLLLIPYYPFWSIVVIALDLWVTRALTRPGAIRT